jgi:L-lactate dehydrogenase complex protein LldF
MGIEKVIPRLSDLALLQPMLGTAGTGQLMTCYNSLYGGGKLPGEVDGPEEMHLVLLDNNRTQMLADPHLRDAMRCIRCGACLNVCPIFKNVGGFTYGTTYQGPIGSVITPPLRGVGDFGHLAFASSLCGACTETCPVKIDLHHHLLYIRAKAVARGRGLLERLMMKAFAFGMKRPRLYRAGARVGLTLDGWVKFIRGTVVDPLGAWRKTRTLPEKPAQSFSQWWESEHKGGQ